MKNLLFTLGITLLCTVLNAQSSHFFYNYRGEKIFLSLNTNYAFLSVREQQQPTNMLRQRGIEAGTFRSDGIGYVLLPNDAQVRNEILQADESGQNWVLTKQQAAPRFYTRLSFEAGMSDEEYLNLLSDIRRQNQGVIISPFFKTDRDNMVGLSNFFYVRLKEEGDIGLLIQKALQTNSIIIEQDPFMPLWYVLSITEASELNAMETANLFFESGLFKAAKPDLMLNLLQSVNDPFFADQWGLQNVGQYGGVPGIDIRILEAWQITTGENVIVAVLDTGVELDHPDLIANTDSLLSFDTLSRTSPSVVHYAWPYHRCAHGTAVAGIIAAEKNNSIGIAGVAPNSRIMSISDDLGGVTVLQQRNLAAGINWAWRNGADVINNSWGHHLFRGSYYITNAVNNAVTYGRKRYGVRLGTVVVAASGNEGWDIVSSPAYLPNVIAVGAISPCGERKSYTSCDTEWWWGSNFGQGLDVVAPGVLISTTDLQGSAGYNPDIPIHRPDYPHLVGSLITTDYDDLDYTVWFTGTSAAAPFVSGVAALVLSVNPYLTEQEVRRIIKRTARRINEYCSVNNPDGYYYEYTPWWWRYTRRWNEQVGHGLVDAYAAVREAQQTASCRGILFANQFITFNRTITGDYNICIIDTTINNGTLTLKAARNIYISNVTVQNRARLILYAGGEVFFDGDFYVQLGGDFEIR